MDHPLTIIIPFLNEGSNVAKTVSSIRETCTLDVQIILIDDVSTDGFDYVRVAQDYNCAYYKNHERRGVARCRDIGVRCAQSQNIMLLDAHMKFFENGWENEVLSNLNVDGKSIFCAKSLPMNLDWEIYPNTRIGKGVYLLPDDQTEQLFGYKWIEDKEHAIIPCVMGAAYCFTKKYYMTLGGLRGLQQWGLDEQYLSIKSYMAGGNCKLLRNLTIGHVYRRLQPYPLYKIFTAYNQLFIPFTLMAEQDAFEYVYARKSKINGFDKAINLIAKDKSYIDKTRKFLEERLFERTFTDFLTFNAGFSSKTPSSSVG